jgi:hypothetical protein
MREQLLKLLEQTIDTRVELEAFLASLDQETDTVDTVRRARYSLRSAIEYLLEAYGLAVADEKDATPKPEVAS